MWESLPFQNPAMRLKGKYFIRSVVTTVDIFSHQKCYTDPIRKAHFKLINPCNLIFFPSLCDIFISLNKYVVSS
jgi:hypothetical protein